MTRPLDVATLPANPIDRAAAIKERATPAVDKPAVSPQAERRLEPIDQKTADSYNEIEEFTYRLHRVAKRIENGAAQTPVGPRARAATQH